MTVTWTDDDGTQFLPVHGPADLVALQGGTVEVAGQFPTSRRTAWSVQLGNYVTRGGSVIHRAAHRDGVTFAGR